MIYTALLAPHESPNSSLEIKRALLTYEKVLIIDPNDRDLIPSNSLASVLMGMPLFGMSMGDVRPMGKVQDYDERFERVIDGASEAVKQGLIEVCSTYQPHKSGKVTIGGVPLGGYPIDPSSVYWIYRAMASNQDFLASAVQDRADVQDLLSQSANISLPGSGDRGINDLPELPLFDQYEESTILARSRLAAFIKYAGYCEAKEIVPVFDSNIYGGIASQLLSNASAALRIADEDGELIRAGRVLELCHDEFIDDAALQNISIREVIKLRTSAWGRQAKSREELFSSVFELANENSRSSNFETTARELISNYKKTSEDLSLERKNLKFQIKCDLGKAALSLTGAEGIISQLESPFVGAFGTVVAGGYWALDKAKEYIPQLRQLKQQEARMKRGAAFGMHNFYTHPRIKKITK
ncbi:hypothetical protein M2D63_000515 [Pseudomonas sp. BJa5]|uniref:hypothetical protein n=1 Tax=Pseudomonas sp. BJa5 TaxID=2936270 RepID=UPI002559F54A|nr:hypothetical protein [Pseudomonas sp. BGr12]MDL2419599.1 hypothetical protein [Pseudomonas sp. BGr12]